jgi:hypothetical protein
MHKTAVNAKAQLGGAGNQKSYCRVIILPKVEKFGKKLRAPH